MSVHGKAAEAPDPDARATATVVLVGAIILVIVVVLVQGFYEAAARGEFKRKVESVAPAELRRLRAAQLARLNETAWVDRQNGFVEIPIERSIALLLADANPAAPIVLPAPPVPPPSPSPPAAGKPKP